MLPGGNHHRFEAALGSIQRLSLVVNCEGPTVSTKVYKKMKVRTYSPNLHRHFHSHCLSWDCPVWHSRACRLTEAVSLRMH